MKITNIVPAILLSILCLQPAIVVAQKPTPTSSLNKALDEIEQETKPKKKGFWTKWKVLGVMVVGFVALCMTVDLYFDVDQLLGDNTKDYYGILGVDKDASPQDIKHARDQLARKYHSDKNQLNDSEEIKEINEAYKVLSDIKKRRAYDYKHEDYVSNTPDYKPYSRPADISKPSKRHSISNVD